MGGVKKVVTAIDVSRHQIVTIEDLEKFQREIVSEFREIVQQIFEQNKTKKYLKSYEVKELLNISTGTLNHLRANGTLPYTKIGGMLLYDYDDINKLIEQNKSSLKGGSLLRSTGLGMRK
ncbi:helix-turn-helix domain-containing protein [Chitinophaga sp. XS-30]|uniref:helix-turn-helix domain-containing protein n=1 Tax=Chitinophaga sp. XS-30 TaxID=2604421 RepID=UPI0011DE1E3A|nr:helix-turn-helix domain-containing protein [Chitinophaga sp. XS-30]QEH39469.1 helix-turn-helix domain-containing protein [Chitinophaga sp. XS-30]